MRLKTKDGSAVFYPLLMAGLVWLLGASVLPEMVTVAFGQPSVCIVHITGISPRRRGRQEFTIREGPRLVQHNYLQIYTPAEIEGVHLGTPLKLVGKKSILGMAVRDVYLPNGLKLTRGIGLRPPTLPPRTGGTGTIN